MSFLHRVSVTFSEVFVQSFSVLILWPKKDVGA